MHELKELLQKQNEAFAAFKSANDAERVALKKQVERSRMRSTSVQKKMGRPGPGAGPDRTGTSVRAEGDRSVPARQGRAHSRTEGPDHRRPAGGWRLRGHRGSSAGACCRSRSRRGRCGRFRS